MKKPVSYLQTDSRWANVDYSAAGESTTIGRSGCGPTCMAMVIATWKDKSVTPVDTCAWALKHGYKAKGQGTYYSYFEPQGKAYDLKVERMNTVNLYGNSTSAVHQSAVKAIQAGNLVIACMGPGNWTSSGHFILLYETDGTMVSINDPASTKTARTYAKLSLLRGQVKYYFVCYKPEEEEMTQEQFNSMMNTYLLNLANESPSDWSKEARNWAEKNGIISGDQHGNKQYKKFCTREELVQILYNQKGR